MKNLSHNVRWGIMLLSLGLMPIAHAQTMDELLEQAKNVRAAENQLMEQNSSKFNAAAPADQQAMMADAEAKRAAIQADVQAKANTYSLNDVQINTLNTQLRDKMRELGLGELFGLARQVAGDSTTVLQQSLVNAQFYGDGSDTRVDFLRKFAAEEGVASPADLERVWFELQREMTASGQVATFTGPVVEPNGNLTSSKITRIGSFTAMADGKYLAYLPALSRLNILPRQLPDEFLAVAREVQQTTSGYVGAAVDPTRGVLMAMYVERPTWMERIHKGEEVGYVIITVGLLGAAAFIFQLIYLVISRMAVSAQMRNLQKPTKNNALGRVLLAFKGDGKNIEADAEVAELRISEAVMKEMPALERFQPFLRLAVAAGPLLGLVGTVVGMIMTFQSITESGSSDPKLMANGIGQAMIATVLGLGIAVPLLFAGALLNSISRSIIQVLDEQSTGLLAENIEKRHHG